MSLSYGSLVVKGGFLRSLNPIVKLVCAISMFLVSLLIMGPVPLTLYFLFIFLVMAASRMGKPALKLLALLLPFSMLLGCVNYLASGDVSDGVRTFYHIMFLGESTAFFTFSTTPAELVRSMDGLGVPPLLTIGTLVSVRFVPVFIQECVKIFQSLRLRGGSFKRGAYFYYRAMLIPLLYKIITLSDAITLSLHTRGFDPSRKRVNYHEIGFRLVDVLFVLLFAAVSGVAVMA